MRATWLSVVAGLVLLFASVVSMRAEPPAQGKFPPRPAAAAAASSGLEGAGVEGLTLGPVQRFENLVIFPVVSREARNADNYITLDEGLLSGKVKVAEVGAAAATARQAAGQPAASDPFANGNRLGNAGNDVGGNVNRLVVTNESGKPLYLMPGEIIVGGKQDRTLAESLVIANNGKPVEVNVFCVEHGRWHLRGHAEMAQFCQTLSSGKLGAAKALELSTKALAGELVISGNSLGKGQRLNVNGGTTQGQVWQSVGASNNAAGNASASGAFTENYTAPNVLKKLNPYVDAVEKPIAATERVVGVVVAVNGKLEMADVFESTPLFHKLWPKLLKSYALDAMMAAAPQPVVDKPAAGKANAPKPGAATPEAVKPGAVKPAKDCTPEEALAFLAQAHGAAVKKTDQRPGVVATLRASSASDSFSASPQPADPLAAPAKAIHIATFAK